jgi:iron complex outermembrane receptor protein
MVVLAGLGAATASSRVMADDAAGANPKDATGTEPARPDSMPMTKNVISRGTLDAQNPQDTYDALKNVAGVTNSNSKGTVADNINIRGIPLSFSTSYRLNGGLPIVNISTIPTENKERIEALKGANALMFGIASPAGIVNLVTKRATLAPVQSVSVSANSFGQRGVAADVGRKFGDEKQFGLRANLSDTHLETGIRHANGSSRFAGLAADWKIGSFGGLRLDYEKYDRNVIEQAQLSQLKAVNGVIAVPPVPDPTRLLSGPWAVYRPTSENILLRGDVRLADQWQAVVEGGRAKSDRSRVISRIGSYSIATGQGTESVTLVQTGYRNLYAKAEVLGRFAIGPARHSLTFGVMSNERDASVPSTGAVSVGQNIYDPVPIPTLALKSPSGFLSQVSKDTGLYAYDTIGLGESWQVLAGLRRTTYRADNELAAGGHAVTTTHSSSPAFGVIYTVVPQTQVYASYMKGLEETGIAPVGTTNQFAILPPAAATQSEVGIRSASIAGLSASAAVFDITRANTVIDSASNTFLIDGTTKYQGLEATVSAELGPHWTLSSAGQLMRAEQRSVIDKTINGLTPESTPRQSGNLSLTHRPAAVKGLTLSAGANFVGRRAINPQNQAYIPGVTLFSLGAGYATRVAGHGLALQLNVDNLADKRYWSSAGSGAYAVGGVRGLRLNAKIDL